MDKKKDMQKYLISNNLVFKLVTEDDAKFILELRRNENLNKYISPTDASIDEQKKWINNYKDREADKEEYYFRIDTNDNEQLGFVRVYNINYDTGEFTWGSWIMKQEHPKLAAIESALIIYEFCFNYLELKKAVFDVRQKNERVLHFHDRFGATRTHSDDLDQYYELSKETYDKLKEEKYSDFLNK